MKKVLMRVVVVCLIAVLTVGGTVSTAFAANPFLPLWEHIPDGEPYVFEDPDNPGEYRVYIYGSHDIAVTRYCGWDYVVWSAPIDDLNNWEYHGVAYDECGGQYLLAPDVMYYEGLYYMFVHCMPSGHIAVSDRPEGPFIALEGDPHDAANKTGVGFDPGVLADDDGSVWAYWGSAVVAQLDPENNFKVIPETQINGHLPEEFGFYEASSIRKIEDKYIFVYSERKEDDPENGYPWGEHGYRANLSYAYGDSPTGPWTYGGHIIDNGGEILEDGSRTYPYGNNHGSIEKIGEQWYVFYHRQTNNNEFSRQAMVEPIDVRIVDGAVVIDQVEMTSQGFELDGLDPYRKTAAGYACYLTGGLYIARMEGIDDLNPITNITDGGVAGYKYFNFGDGVDNMQLTLDILPKGAAGTVDIVLDSPFNGDVIGSFALDGAALDEYIQVTTGVDRVSGKHALFFVFHSEEEGEICDINFFEFTEGEGDLRLATTAHNVQAGDFIPVTVSFNEEQPANTVILNFTFDAAKFRYNGYSVDKVEGVTLVDYQSGEGWAKVTLMAPGYDMEDLGYLGLVAKEDATLARERQWVNLTAEYVLRDEDGGKSVAEAKSKVSFTTGGSDPDLLGDTNDDGVVDILDLSNMIDWFGYTSGNQSDWDDWYSLFDFNNNGEIDISDIVFVARLI